MKGRMQEPLLKHWCVLASKIEIFEDRVVIKRAFGLSKTVLPISKIASVNHSFMGIEFETSGGKRPLKLQCYNARNNEKVADLVLSLINKSSTH